MLLITLAQKVSKWVLRRLEREVGNPHCIYFKTKKVHVNDSLRLSLCRSDLIVCIERNANDWLLICIIILKGFRLYPPHRIAREISNCGGGLAWRCSELHLSAPTFVTVQFSDFNTQTNFLYLRFLISS